jgi:serine/threonine protein kinase
MYSQPSKVLGAEFNIDKRYKIIDAIGSGAYGIVVAAQDLITHKMVAIKKVEKAFEHPIYTKRTLRELKIARLMHHDNVLGVEAI